MRPLVCVLLLVLTVAAPCPPAAGKEAKEKPLPPPPPQPVPWSLSVPRGGHLEIPLRVYGSQPEIPRFLIRSQPEHGRLSAQAVRADDTVVVQYDPPADLAVTSVRFTYAAQNSLGVSAPTEVTIKILDEPARLITPASLDFESILAGRRARQDFEITNTGGGISSGEVQVGKPWRIEPPAQYRLAAGERRRVTLVFEPGTADRFHSEVRYTSQPERATALSGEATAPLALTPNPLLLTHPPRDPERRGSVTIANRTAEEVILAIKSVPRLHLPEEITVPAHGEFPLPVTVAPADTAQVREEVVFTGAGVTLRLPVTAPAVEPILLADTERMQLPPVASGRATTGTVTFRNPGASPGFWKCDAPPPFSAAPAEFRIPPEGEQVVTLRCAATEPGPCQSRIRFIGEQQTVEVQVETEILARATDNPLKPVSLTAVGDLGRAVETVEAVASGPEETPAPTIRAVPGVVISGCTDHSITLRWPTTLSSGRPVQVEARNLRLDAKHELLQEWKKLTVTFKTQGAETVAEIRKLQPSAIYSMRVVPAGVGADRPALFFIDAATAQAEPRWSPSHLIVLGLCAVAGLIAWKRFRG